MQQHETNRELRKIKAKYGFTYKEIAVLMEVKIDAVKSYLSTPTTTRYTRLPVLNIKYLKLLIKTEGIKPKQF